MNDSNRVSKEMEKKYMMIIGVVLAVTILVVLIFTFLPKKNTQNFEYVDDDENLQCNIPENEMNMSMIGKLIEVKNKNKTIKINDDEFTIKLPQPSILLQLSGDFENLKISFCDENLKQLLYLYREDDDLIIQTPDFRNVQKYDNAFCDKKILIISHITHLKIDNKYFISNKLESMKYLLVTAPKKIRDITTTQINLFEKLGRISEENTN